MQFNPKSLLLIQPKHITANVKRHTPELIRCNCNQITFHIFITVTLKRQILLIMKITCYGTKKSKGHKFRKKNC